MAKSNETSTVTLDQVIAAQAAAVEAQAKYDRYAKEIIASQRRHERYGIEAINSKNQADSIRRQFEQQAK